MKTSAGAPFGGEREALSRAPEKELNYSNPIAERDEILRKAEELAKTNADLNQFACMAWHDLQEPLRAIGIYAELLRRHHHLQMDDDADRMIGAISGAVQRMETLIRAMLAYSRAGAEQVVQEEEEKSVDATEALEFAIANVSLMIEESGTLVDWEPLPTVPWPLDQLTQIFQNLLSNAIKYRGPDPLRIRVSASLAGGEWVVSVADNGLGIAPDHHEAIFRPFKRLHNSNYPGTGIGLALCRRIVERNGGRIWVESQPGKGATFRFSIPVEKKTGGPGGRPHSTVSRASAA